jgi:hypothetical protein
MRRNLQTLSAEENTQLFGSGFGGGAEYCSERSSFPLRSIPESVLRAGRNFYEIPRTSRDPMKLSTLVA